MFGMSWWVEIEEPADIFKVHSAYDFSLSEQREITSEVSTVMTGVVRYHPHGPFRRGIPSPSPMAIPPPTHRADSYPRLPFFVTTKGPTQIVGSFSTKCTPTTILHKSKLVVIL